MTKMECKRPLNRHACFLVLAFLAGLFLVGEKTNLALAAFPAVLFLSWQGRRFSRWWQLALIVATILGMLWGGWADKNATALAPLVGQEVLLQGQVERVVHGRPQLDLKLEKINEEPLKRPVRLRLSRVWADDEMLLRGSKVVATAKIRKTEGPRNPGGYDEAAVLYGRGIRYVAKASQPLIVQRLPQGTMAALMRLQMALTETLDRRFDDAGAALMKGILLGDASQLSEAFYHRAQLLSIVHLFAVSGLHIGFVVAFALGIGKLFSLTGRPIFFYLLFFLLLIYVLLTAAQPSAVRASIMALAGFQLFRLARYRDPWTILAYAALVLVLFNPWSLWQLGFRLSFAITAALIALRPQLYFLLPPLPHALRGALAVALAAEWAAAPVIAYHFHLLTLFGVPVNLLLVPLVGLLVPMTFIALLFDAFLPILARPLFFLAQGLIDIILYLIQSPGQVFSKYHLHVGSPSVMATWLSGALIVLMATGFVQRRLKGSGYPPQVAMVLLPLSLLLLWQPAPRDLALSVIDVNQGSAAAWQTEDGHWFCFDFGENSDTCAAYLRAAGVNRLEALVLSHADLDHVGGLPRLLEDFQVSHLFCSRSAWENEKLDGVRKSLGKTTLHLVEEEMNLQLGEAQLKLALCGAGPVDAPNANEVVARVEDGITVLFPGDCDAEALDDIPWSGPVDIILVPHHGSRYSWNESFMRQQQPAFAIASCGRNNRFGHPHPLIVEGYLALEIPFYTTAENGCWRGYRVAQGLRLSRFVPSD